jgi:hypothetical protein
MAWGDSKNIKSPEHTHFSNTMEWDCDRKARLRDGWKAIMALACLTGAMHVASAQRAFPGFTVDSVWSEQSVTFNFSPQVRVVVNAPAPGSFRASASVSLVLYALPNGNTIEQTAGKQVREGTDWHFGIQHIAAQMRLLRRRDRSTNYVLAYLETQQKSWPSWRSSTPESGRHIRDLVDTIRTLIPGEPFVTIAGHSGGGSFLFGFINASDRIPEFVRRFVFLDANYGFDTTDRHEHKFMEWLRRSDQNVLVVVAYDDRNIVLNGKPVVGPTGGTYRRTLEMVGAFRSLGAPLEASSDSAFTWYRSRTPAAILAIHRNPLNTILHTVLVERNGLLFGLSAFTPAETRVSPFWGPVEYSPYIQP